MSFAVKIMDAYDPILTAEIMKKASGWFRTPAQKKKLRQRALKACATRRANEACMSPKKLAAKRRSTALKAWDTRRKRRSTALKACAARRANEANMSPKKLAAKRRAAALKAWSTRRHYYGSQGSSAK